MPGPGPTPALSATDSTPEIHSSAPTRTGGTISRVQTVPMPAEESTPQRTRNPWGQGERLRTEILEAAARLLSELDSAEGITIRGVARAVGIAPASIYQHFSDKAALVQGIVGYDFELLMAAMHKAEERLAAEDVVGRVRAQMHAYCRFAMEHPGHYRLMLSLRDAAHQQRGNSLPEGPLLKLVELLTESFVRCEQAGHRLRVSAERAAIIVFVGAHGLVALWHASPEDDDSEIRSLVDEQISMVFADC